MVNPDESKDLGSIISKKLSYNKCCFSLFFIVLLRCLGNLHRTIQLNLTKALAQQLLLKQKHTGRYKYVFMSLNIRSEEPKRTIKRKGEIDFNDLSSFFLRSIIKIKAFFPFSFTLGYLIRKAINLAKLTKYGAFMKNEKSMSINTYMHFQRHTFSFRMFSLIMSCINYFMY